MSNSAFIYELVRRIPPGRVASYGAVGKSGPVHFVPIAVGKLMAICTPDIPWWRVVGSDGSLVIAKRNPGFAMTQREKLEAEGVVFDGDKVPRQFFLSLDELADLANF